MLGLLIFLVGIVEDLEILLLLNNWIELADEFLQANWKTTLDYSLDSQVTGKQTILVLMETFFFCKWVISIQARQV